MSSVTSVRSHVDQENSQASRAKNGVQGRSFGPAKTFHSNTNNAPLATPRRALGDVGNRLTTPGNLNKKALLLKPNHQSLLQSKTPGTKRITRATPHGKGLSKQIGSLSVQSNKRQAFQVRGNVQTSSEHKSSTLGKDCFKKEKMIPFTDEETPLPRGPAIDTILNNVSWLYRGCLQPVDNTTMSFDTDFLKMETITRPETDSLFSWLEFDDDFTDLESNIPSSLEDFELPPVDTDLSSLGLP